MQKLVEYSLCIPSADILQPFLLVYVNSCMTIKCSKLLYAVLTRKDIIVAKYVCGNNDLRVQILCFVG
jgi:hypothetical protein